MSLQMLRLMLPKRAIKLWCRIFVMLIGTGVAAHAGEYYDALNDAAVQVKTPANTPLIAITRQGSRLVAVGRHGVIIISDDDGATWRQAAVPVDLTLTSVFFSSRTDVWAAGHYGVILHSTDAGLTWAKCLDGRNVVKDLNEASNQAQASSMASPGTALKLRVATAFEKAGPSKPFLALGQCGKGVLAAGQQDMAMFSPDQGKTWQSWTSRIDNPNFKNIYDILSSGDKTLLIGEGGLVLESDFDCSNFKALPGPYTTTLFGGMLLGQQRIILYGLDGGLFSSADRGATWLTVPMPQDSVIGAGAILPSGRFIVGTLNGTLYLGDAAGDSFHQLSVTEPFEIADMIVARTGNIIIVGNGGVGIVASGLIH